MSRRCTHENCFTDTTCALGHINREECENWKEQNDEAEGNPQGEDVATSDIPWNGYALGLSDLSIVSGRGQPIVLGLIGPPGSGKTSMLAFLYMWLLKHGQLGDWDFAGSWTLGGWESVVHRCRWTGELPPSFPPHTSSAGRHPGVLHLALRHRTTGNIRDVLMTDAPGEWFTHWARSPDDGAVVGARWVITHSDTLLVLIDTAALADPERLPQARRATRDLLERVGAEAMSRPLMVVWAKDDVEIASSIREVMTRTRNDFTPDSLEVRTTVVAPETIITCIAEAISLAERRALATCFAEPRFSHEPFLALRRVHGGT